MKLRHSRTVLAPQVPEAPAQGGALPARVTALAWAPNNARFAAVTTERVVSLFDEAGERRDKFSTKAGSPATRAYVVTAMAFSPDSTRLLVAQSDNIVFVYKLGLDWADKKSICNKFASPAAVTCALWPALCANEVVFGCSDGRVRVGSLKTNKAVAIYAHSGGGAGAAGAGTGAGGDSGAPSSSGFVVSMCCAPDGRTLLAGHLDGTVYRFVIDGGGNGTSMLFMRLFSHSCAPYGLAWGAQVLAAGPDGRVCFYDENDGSLQRTFDFATPDGVPCDLTCAAFNPSGEAVVVGTYDRLIVLTLSSSPPATVAQLGFGGSGGGGAAGGGRRGQAASPVREWVESGSRNIPNLYLASALAWKADGSRLAVGNITGCCAVFDACLKRVRYRGKFEFTYISLSTVIVKRLASGMRIVLRSSFGHEITRIRIFQDRFLVAHTPATLLVGDLDSCKLSEVAWASSSASAAVAPSSKSKIAAAASPAERFFFDNPSVCLVYRAGEVTLIEYGRTEVLGMVRTELMSPHVVSVRIDERPPSRAAVARLALLSSSEGGADAAAVAAAQAAAQAHCKRIAYLVDPHTLHVMDLLSSTTLCMLSWADARIDWLELSGRGNLVLFRDKRRRLHLFNVATQTRHTLLDLCSYAQWVPGSDVVVAQRGRQLCVWYNIAHAPEKVTTYEITGDIETIERVGMGKTEVLVDEGLTTASYLLDETLISFGTAMDDGDLEVACQTLESVGSRAPASSALSGSATSSASASAASSAQASSSSPEVVEAMWQLLSSQAIAQGALAVASRCAIALGDVARARYLSHALKSPPGGEGATAPPWLVQARLSTLSGDLGAAEALLTRQGGPGGVDAAIAMYQQLHRYDVAIAVAEAHGKPGADAMRHQYFAYLVDSGQEERAAALKEHEGDSLGAISLYLRGGYPARALAIAMAAKQGLAAFPRDVLERIAVALASASMYDKCGGLLERMGDQTRAMDAYMRGRSPAFRPAVDLARRAFPHRVVELERSWGEWLVQHKQVDAAINHFIEAGAHLQAINAALDSRQFSKAAQLVQDTLHEDAAAARPFWRRLARAFQDRGNLEEAERYLIRAGDGRAAVDLYLQAGKFEAAHRVARSCMGEGEIAALYTQQAQRMEAAGQLRQAERLYLAVRAFDSAILMFRRAKQWDSVVRIVAAHRPEQLRDTHLAVARTLQGEGSLRAAERHFVEGGQAEQAVAMYQTALRWDDAMRCARQIAMANGGANGTASLANRVAYAQALSLGSDQGMKLLHRLGLVETAIDFACEAGDWDRALDLASRAPYSPPAAAPGQLQPSGQSVAAATARERERLVHGVSLKRAMKLEDQGQYSAAEQAFVQAERPREAIEMYLHLRDWAAAMRVAEGFDPASICDVLEAQGRAAVATGDTARAEQLFIDARKPELAIDAWFDARQYPEALRVTKQYLPNRVSEVADRIKRAVGDAAGSAGVSGQGRSGPGGRQDSPSPDRGRKGGVAATTGQPVVSGLGRGGAGGTGPAGAGASQGGARAGGPSPATDPVSTARMWESSREWARAIEAYLQVNPGAGGADAASCVAAWQQALSVASQHERSRYADVADDVAHRLAELGGSLGGVGDGVRFLEMAGDLFREIEQVPEAADCYVQAQAWSKAKEVAKGGLPKLREAVDAAFKAALLRSGDPASMAAAGAVNEAIAVYVSQGGQTDKVFELAAKSSPQLLAQHLYPHCEELITSAGGGSGGGGGGGPEAALALLTRYGAPAAGIALPVMRRLVVELFGGTQQRRCADAAVHEARGVLARFAANVRKAGGGIAAGSVEEAERLLQVVHLSAMRLQLEELGLGELAARAAISVLRFAGVAPAPPVDRAYFEAGLACRSAGWKGMALVLLNRFIDICEAIEDGGGGGDIENGDFAGSGIPVPSEYVGGLPRNCFVGERAREEVKDWVLTTSMDRSVQQALARRPCLSCGAQVFEGALSCAGCGAQFPSCSITGYAMTAAQSTTCSCGARFAKPAFNAFVGKARCCPSCGIAAKVSL